MQFCRCSNKNSVLGMNVENTRKDFPLLRKRVNGKPIVYFDNAASSLKPVQVIEAMNNYYTELSSNVHRGLHRLSEQASELYEQSHKTVASFINAKETEAVFTKNTTESINLVMYSLLNDGFFKKGDEILVSRMEHHSNLLPWQFVEKKFGAKLKFIGLNADFSINMHDLQEKMGKKVRLVSIAHASNTVASIAPVAEISRIAHDSNALFLVDAAQSAPHMQLDVKKISADFLAFSAYKMLGPTGIAALFARHELLERMPPFMFGSDMIKSVSWHNAEWNDLPYKFEAGTPNIAGAIGFGAAVDYLQERGMGEINSYGKKLTKHALEAMQRIDGVKLYCPKDAERQAPIVLFELQGLNCHDLAIALDEASNIAIRSGMQCAEPIVSSINKGGLGRASFYLYNTKEEIDLLAQNLETLSKEFFKTGIKIKN